MTVLKFEPGAGPVGHSGMCLFGTARFSRLDVSRLSFEAPSGGVRAPLGCGLWTAIAAMARIIDNLDIGHISSDRNSGRLCAMACVCSMCLHFDQDLLRLLVGASTDCRFIKRAIGSCGL